MAVQSQRFRQLGLGLAPLQSPSDGVVRIATAPVGLHLPPPRRLILRPIAGSLADAYAWIGMEPLAADGAGSLAGLGPTSPRCAPAWLGADLNGWAISEKRRWVSFGRRRSSDEASAM
jgi:hypothetical protein